MKNITKLIILIAALMIITSCTISGGPEDTSFPGDTTLKNGDVIGEDISNGDTSEKKQNPDTYIVESNETVDINTPKLRDIFDIDLSRKEDENWVKELQLTYKLGNENGWKCSFEEVVDVLGKPHGFRPGYPDMLVWVTESGAMYSIRFELDEDINGPIQNAYDQLLHSHSAFYHPVLCLEMCDPQQFDINVLPIVEREPLFDPSISWEKQFYELDQSLMPSDDYLNAIVTRGILFEDIITFIGKPCGAQIGNNFTQCLVWMSNEGHYYRLGFNIQINTPFPNLIFYMQGKYNHGTKPELLSERYVKTDTYSFLYVY